MQSVKRYRRVVISILAAVVLSQPALAQKNDSAPAPQTPFSNVRRDSLLNGLQVVSLERSADLKVKCYLVIRAGSMFDLAGKTGQARLTMDTLLAVNPRLREEIESLQGSIEWGVNSDSTWFNLEIPPASFDTAIEILGRLLVVESVRTDSFKAAQQALLAEIKGAKPTLAERADESFLKAIYGDHPYGHTLRGTELTVAGIRQGDVFDFLRRFYIANNASIVVAGNIPHDRAMKTLKIVFGGWMKGQLTPATFRPPAQNAQLRVIKVDQPDAASVEIRGGVLGARVSDPDYLVTELMARLLQSRLGGTEVRAPAKILPGPFVFSASVAADGAPEISRRITEAYASLASGEVTAQELAEARAWLVKKYADRPVEMHLRDIEAYSLPRNFPLEVVPRIEKLTAADIQRVARRLLDANALTLVVTGRIAEGVK